MAKTEWFRLLAILITVACSVIPVDALGDAVPTASTAETCDSKSETNATFPIKDDVPACGLFLAESHLGFLGIYAGVDIEAGDLIGEPEILVPMVDANMNEWSMWHEVFWNGDISPELLLQNAFNMHALIPGIGSHVHCHETYSNAIMETENSIIDSVGLHRSKDPGAGAFSYRHNVTGRAFERIRAGEEIFLTCATTMDVELDELPSARTPEWLREHGFCIDNLRPGISTIPGAGRGAFAKRALKKGSIVSPSPVVTMDRRQMDIVEQSLLTSDDEEEESKVIFTNRKKALQLMLNYCFGSKDSNMLILPYGPSVNLINHDSKDPNVAIRWSASQSDLEELFEMPSYDLLAASRDLMIEYVALRDINEGEEIFLDYGKDWEEAWLKHKENWTPSEDSNKYISAADFINAHGSEPLRTSVEQQTNPYPENIRTACFFMETSADVFNVDDRGRIVWGERNNECLRPCEIYERSNVRGSSGGNVYTALMRPINATRFPEHCELSTDDVVVTSIPSHQIKVVDRQYTSDQHLSNAFRHDIGAPPDLFPESWMKGLPKRSTSFAKPVLKQAEISPMTLVGDGRTISEFAHRVGLPPRLSQELLAYCDRMGITERFRSLLIDGNPLPPGEDSYEVFGDYNWYVQRPPSKWRSNMHWISPADETAHVDYLRVLGKAGFDDLLASLGNYFGLDGLACYHLTFIGVSHCSRGYIHYDFQNTGGKAFNMIIPLILANETGPELDVRSDDMSFIGGYKYERDVASLVGDDAYHATAACDYRDTGEMRMAATIYIADINYDNVNSILRDFTQAYPPSGDHDYLLARAGSHWKRDDPSKRLPLPLGHGDFILSTLNHSQIEPMKLNKNAEIIAKYAFRVGLPSRLSDHLLKYCNRMGITQKFASLVSDEPLKPGTNEFTQFRGQNWYIQRPNSFWKSNMHWISPADEPSHVDYLRVLGSGGFDELLDSIGSYFGLDGLVCYHLTFIAVSHCDEGYIHYDFTRTGGKAFNMIIPLILAKETTPELDIRADDESMIGGYRYEFDVASMLGDDAHHATAACDYRQTGEMRMAATIYIADVNRDNVDSILKDFTQAFPPSDDPDYLLGLAGSHWKRDDPTKQLPRLVETGDFSAVPLKHAELSQITWASNNGVVADYAFRIGLPPRLPEVLRDYCDRMGITDTFRRLEIEGNPLEPGHNQYKQFGGYNWYIQRPNSFWESNMHWISPADETAHIDYLRVLSSGGFDDLLNSIGNYFKLEGLVCYHLTFIAVSHCSQGYMHYDFTGAAGKAFNMIIPLILANETGPELDIRSDDGLMVGGYRNEYNVGSMMGDDAYHATAACDYRKAGEMRMAATIYMADINEGNVDAILDDFTQAYPPQEDPGYLLARAGSHWLAGDPTRRLPKPLGPDEL